MDEHSGRHPDGGSLLLVSQNSQDELFWRGIAGVSGLSFARETDPIAVEAFLAVAPSSFVVWSLDGPSKNEVLAVLARAQCQPQARSQPQARRCHPSRVIAVADQPVNRDLDIPLPPPFAHHILRRYEDPAPFLYSRLLRAARTGEPFGLLSYFPDASPCETITLRRSSDRASALDRVERLLGELGVQPKLARLGVDAADELLMNALFDAPCAEEGGYYRKKADRSIPFDLSERETVELRLAGCPDFVGISVADRFGSLGREKILRYLWQDYQVTPYVPPPDEASAGIGLHRINRLPLSLLFAAKPGERTEVSVLFPNTKTYREFLQGFCFFGIFAD